MEGRVYHLKLDKGRELKNALNSFSLMPEVQQVEPVPRIKITD